MRGEYDAEGRTWFTILELPPRARRIPVRAGERGRCGGTTSACAENTAFPGFLHGSFGTTSACAENTPPSPRRRWPSRNYLRVRGEYTPVKPTGGKNSELPPRARRILGGRPDDPDLEGTTSACAENTARDPPQTYETRNYLRVRGEYYAKREAARSHLELPPRARRIP